MIKLYDKSFSNCFGSIENIIECLVEEERNGLFELSIEMLNTDSLFSYIEKENIIECNANDTLLNQKFRIYNIRKLMNNRVQVLARHISFDLMYDYINNISIENQSCEYALNQLFRNSNFSQHYKGYSDIVSTQNYNISDINVLAAIAGTEGSIIDTYGNGAEILRDNENIYVLSKRGHDNSVTIEYKKNLTGFELEEDTTDLVTRILPYAKYTPEGEEEIIIKANYVDSAFINNYSHPYIKTIDYTDKFEDNERPTIEKLVRFAELEYTVNEIDFPKQNYKIDFIPLSECIGYEGLSDKISLCDTVTIKDTRYNINTQSKVIRAVFDVLKNRYETIELGEPKTSLGDIIGNSNDKVTEEEVKDIVNNTPSTNYPNTLPGTPVLESFVYGFANIELKWTFENKVYYAYEVYGSKTKDFTPNSFDLLYQGQSSSYMFQAKPNETWYFKVCVINSHSKRTQFSNQVEIVTTKIADLSNYIDNMAIGEALIGELNLGRGWVGQLNANLLDVKGNFSVTDNNGKRTFDIDSFGNMSADFSSLKIKNEGVATSTQLEQTEDKFNFKFENLGKPNLFPNGNPKGGNYEGWYSEGDNAWLRVIDINGPIGISSKNTSGEVFAYSPIIKLNNGGKYSISFSIIKGINIETAEVFLLGGSTTGNLYEYVVNLTGSIGDSNWRKFTITVDIPSNIKYLKVRIDNNKSLSVDKDYTVFFKEFMLIEGEEIYPPNWYSTDNELNNNSVTIDKNGIAVKHNDGSYTKVNSAGLERYNGLTGKKYHYYIYNGSAVIKNWEYTSIPLPEEIRGKVTDFAVTATITKFQLEGTDQNAKLALNSFTLDALTSDMALTKNGVTFIGVVTGIDIFTGYPTFGGTITINYTIIA